MRYKNLLIPNTVISDDLSNQLAHANYQIYAFRHTYQNKVKALSNVLLPYIKIAIIRKGSCNITIQDKKFIGGPGDLFIISPYHIHSAEFISDYLETFEILFQVSGQFSQEQWILQFNHQYYFQGLIKDSHFSLIEHLFENASQKINGYVIQLMHLIDLLAIEMRNQIPQINQTFNYDISLLSTVESFLKELDSSDSFYSVNNYCKILNVSQSYLCRCTLAVLQMSPQTMIIQHRMYHSLIYLSDKSLSIKEISNKLNYLNPNYFSQQFKQTFNVTPSEYRTLYFKFNKSSGLTQ